MNTLKPVGLSFNQRLIYMTLIAGSWGAIDLFHKYYMLEIYNIAEKGVVEFLPFLNLLLVWNKGIAYGMFQQSGGGSMVLAGLTVVVGIILVIIVLRTTEKFSVIYFSFFIGTAIGNGYDRMFREGVVDTLQLVIGGYNWKYVFNIADVAMTLGVLLMLIDIIFFSKSDAKDD